MCLVLVTPVHGCWASQGAADDSSSGSEDDGDTEDGSAFRGGFTAGVDTTEQWSAFETAVYAPVRAYIQDLGDMVIVFDDDLVRMKVWGVRLGSVTVGCTRC